MTELFEPVGDHDWRLALGASRAAGLLSDLNRAGVLESTDLHVARRVGELGGEPDEAVLVAVALAVRSVRHGSVCVDLADAPRLAPDMTWPDAAAWESALAASPLVAGGAVRVEHGLVYLDRYHLLEAQVGRDLVARAAQPAPAVDQAALAAAVGRVDDDHLGDDQRAAVEAATRQWTTVLTGGPGTGKTTTVARLLVAIAAQTPERSPAIALTAPTGKASARLADAVAAELARLPEEDRERVGRGLESMTLHRLLGWRPDNATRFRHHRANKLRHDVVVVDEASMVDLTLFGRLLEAVRPDARLLLVGDPRQLTSVGAGAVLSDLVAGYDGDPASPVVALTRNHRATRDLQALADALRAGDADGVLAALRSGSAELELVETESPEAVLRAGLVAGALAVRRAAERADAAAAVDALDEHRLLCAHREGPHGVRRWNRLIEQWLAEELGHPLSGEWYVGRPLLVTLNDYALGLFNGETGAVVTGPDGRPRAWISRAGGLRDYAPGRLDAVETMHATTVHKAQGSQARRVTVLLPEAGSRLLTRELFYTAVTRAREQVRVVGTEAALRAAVATPAQRATGLRQRLLATRPHSGR